MKSSDYWRIAIFGLASTLLVAAGCLAGFSIVEQLQASWPLRGSETPVLHDAQSGYELAFVNARKHLVLSDIDTGATKEIDLEPLSHAWSPDMSTLAVVSSDNLGAWLISARDGTTRRLTSPAKPVAHTLSWAPSGRFLAFWGSTANTVALHIYDVELDAVSPVHGTDQFNCAFQAPAWSFDDLWLLLSAGVCQSESQTSEVAKSVFAVNKNGEISGTLSGMYFAEAYPSPADYSVAFSMYDSTSNQWKLYVTDFMAPEESLQRITDFPGGRRLWEPRWLPDGNAFYATPMEWPFPEVDLVNTSTGELSVVWSSAADAWAWSPKTGRLAAIDGDAITVFDLLTGDSWGWGKSPVNMCGYIWRDNGNLAAVLTCEHASGVPAFEASVLKSNGAVARLGNEWYVSVLWGRGSVPASGPAGESSEQLIVQPNLDPEQCVEPSSPGTSFPESSLEESNSWFIYDRETKGIFAHSLVDGNERHLSDSFLEAYIPRAFPAPWSPDAESIAFIGDRGAGSALHLMYLDPFRIELLLRIPDDLVLRELAWSSSGTKMAVILSDEWDDLYFVYLVDIQDKSSQEIAAGYDRIHDPRWSVPSHALIGAASTGVLAFVGQNGATHSLLIYDPILGTLKPLSQSTSSIRNLAWSPNQRTLGVVECQSQNDCRVRYIDVDGKIEHIYRAGLSIADISWNPSGDSLAFLANESGGSYLYILRRSLLDLGTTKLSAEERIGPIDGSLDDLTWSPGGERIAFSANRTLVDNPDWWTDFRTDVYVYDLRRGRLRSVTCSFENVWARGATWSPDGSMVAFMDGYGITLATHDGSGIRRVTQGRGSPFWYPRQTSFGESISASSVTSQPQTESQVTLPTPAPTPTNVHAPKPGERNGLVAYVTHGGYETLVLDLETGQTRPVQLEGPGEYCCNQTLLGWSPSGDRLALTSWDIDGGNDVLFIADRSDLTARPVADLAVQVKSSSRWSPNGEFIAFAGGDPGSSVVTGVYAIRVEDGNLRLLADLRADYSRITWSPDSTRVVFAAEDPANRGDRFVFVAGVEGNGFLQLTDNPSDDRPTWAPNASLILFTRQQVFDTLYTMKPDGSEQRPYPGGSRIVYSGGTSGEDPQWSSDGSYFAFKHIYGTESGAWARELAVIEYRSGLSTTFRVPGTSNEYHLTSFDWVASSRLIASIWDGDDLWLIDSTSGESFFISSDVLDYSATAAMP